MLDIGDIYKVDIIDLDSNGRGVAKINNFVLFIEGALPGEVCEIEIVSVKKKFAIAKLVEILEVSLNRVIPKCKHYNQCGGCDIMHMDYKSQIEFKKSKVLNAFKKQSNIELDLKDINFSDQFNYRNKIVIRAKEGKLGFYSRNSNDIVKIEKCIIASHKINEVIEYISSKLDYSDEFKATIKEFDGEVLVSFESNNSDLSKFYQKLDNIILNGETKKGNDFISFNLLNLKLKANSNSFTQVNKHLTEKLYGKVIEHSKDSDEKLLVELYSGIGIMSLALAKNFEKGIGVEINQDSIYYSKINAEANNIKNIKFVKADANKFRVEDKVSLLVVDPPRAGLSSEGIESIDSISPENIIYVSCNPSTLVRDLKLLEKYEIKAISLFDMFPNTLHVESVVFLENKKR